eukprot:TRINITY_DN202_c0_g1_i2.p2 TRINITY_DN202_c0_g1~~TRINITY_DN202_c0_g1_i2.p2  ORF type:complete len:509 (-),score=216.82 TRINITY_DN202_c0_g1_i2:4438-5964(-)
MALYLSATALLLCCHAASGIVELAHRHALFNGAHPRTSPDVQSDKVGDWDTSCTERWFTQTIDHFSWEAPPTGEFTYQQRYYTNDTFWRKDGGCVFFYAGNEADVTLYRDHAGLMWENAAQFGALLVFAEHRYYGESQPFGKASKRHLKYMTHEQAMADYAALAFDLQTNMGVSGQPFIVFGGSYGGMLAAWIRNKYPGTFAGAIAASAPILAFQFMSPPWDPDTYWQVVTRDATAAAGSPPACAPNVQAAWPAIFSAAQTPAGLAQLSEVFGLCTPLQTQHDVEALAILHLNAWDTLAMGNYPYPSNYLTGGGPTLPAWPFREACSYLADSTLINDQWRLLDAFRKATDVFNNATLNVQCYTLPTDMHEDGIYDYQWCTETMPEETYFTSDGKRDMFWPRPCNFTDTIRHCVNKYGVVPRPDWIRIAYQGFEGSSNIAFTNGGYDPWSSGGVTNSSGSLTAIFIPEGGHHLDLFFSNPADPASVIAARKQQASLIADWITEYYAAHS